MIEKLSANEFTDGRYGWIVERAMEISAPELKFNPEYYFPFIRHGMKIGMMEAWSGIDALLVAFYYHHVFTGENVGCVSLWTGPGSPDASALVDTFEAEARKRKCVSVHASSFGPKRVAAMTKIYERKGFVQEEISYMKKINTPKEGK